MTTEYFPADPRVGGGPSATYNVPRTFANGTFGPADGMHAHRPPFSPYARKCDFKDFKKQMKEQIKMMKQAAISDDDWEAVKEAKKQMKEGFKANWNDCQFDKKAWKTQRKAEKDQWKEEKKEKKEKKCEKGKWEKCGKDGKLIARHVADVTIPDNSELPADTPVTKTWRLRYPPLPPFFYFILYFLIFFI